MAEMWTLGFLLSEDPIVLCEVRSLRYEEGEVHILGSCAQWGVCKHALYVRQTIDLLGTYPITFNAPVTVADLARMGADPAFHRSMLIRKAAPRRIAP